FFLVRVRRLVHLIVIAGLEKEMTDLPAGHGDKPAHQGSQRGVLEDHHVGKQEAQRTQQMERLIDPAMMIIAVIVPTLHSQRLQKPVHLFLPSCDSWSLVMAIR